MPTCKMPKCFKDAAEGSNWCSEHKLDSSGIAYEKLDVESLIIGTAIGAVEQPARPIGGIIGWLWKKIKWD